MNHYWDNESNFEERFGRLLKPKGNKEIKQSSALYFCSITLAIQKKYVLNLICLFLFFDGIKFLEDTLKEFTNKSKFKISL